MKFSLKTLSLLAGFAAMGSIASCSPNAPSSEQNDIVLTAKTIALTNSNISDTTDAKLVCGCPFELSVVKHEGDTSMISYDVPIWRNFPGERANIYGIVMKGATGAPAGNYSTTLIVKGGAEGFLDTITTTYTVQ